MRPKPNHTPKPIRQKPCAQNHTPKSHMPRAKPYAQSHTPKTIRLKPYAQSHTPKTIRPNPCAQNQTPKTIRRNPCAQNPTPKSHRPKGKPYAQSHTPNISKKTFLSRRIEPASGRSKSALCLPSFEISRGLFAFYLIRRGRPDAPLSLQSVLRAPCDPTPSRRLPVVSIPLLSRLRPPAYSYQLCVSSGPARSPLTSSDLDLSRVSAHILGCAFLSPHPTVTSIIPLLFTRRPARPP